jgi:PEP-CTERM motif
VGSLTFNAPGVYVIGGVVPETSTWAMLLIGFGGLGFAARLKSTKRTVAAA